MVVLTPGLRAQLLIYEQCKDGSWPCNVAPRQVPARADGLLMDLPVFTLRCSEVNNHMEVVVIQHYDLYSKKTVKVYYYFRQLLLVFLFVCLFYVFFFVFVCFSNKSLFCKPDIYDISNSKLWCPSLSSEHVGRDKTTWTRTAKYDLVIFRTSG